MSARKFTAALFENVDFKAQEAEIAKKEAAKLREKEKRLQMARNKDNSIGGFLSRILSRSSSADIPASASTSSSSSPVVTWPRVLLFGDSLTQYGFGLEGGWAAMLADRLQRKADVVNRGFSGYNTRWCRSIMDQVFAKEAPSELACVIILLGSNDASLPDCFPKTHVPVEEYESNLSSMIDDLVFKFGIAKSKLILVTPPPVNRKMLEEWSPEENGTGAVAADAGDAAEQCCAASAAQPVAYSNDSVSGYAAACLRVGQSADVTVIDMFSRMLSCVDESDSKKSCKDGGATDIMSSENDVEVVDQTTDESDAAQKSETFSSPQNKSSTVTSMNGDYCHLTKPAISSSTTEITSPQLLLVEPPSEPLWHSFFCDGLHFSRNGSEFFYSQLWPLVESRVKDLPFMYPHWGDVNEHDPITSLQNINIFDKDFKFD